MHIGTNTTPHKDRGHFMPSIHKIMWTGTWESRWATYLVHVEFGKTGMKCPWLPFPLASPHVKWPYFARNFRLCRIRTENYVQHNQWFRGYLSQDTKWRGQKTARFLRNSGLCVQRLGYPYLTSKCCALKRTHRSVLCGMVKKWSVVHGHKRVKTSIDCLCGW